MFLSTIFNENKGLGDVVITNEKSFDYLGLTVSEVDGLLCVFLDDEKYIHQLKPNVSMVITNENVSKLMTGTSYGLCIVEKPRESFFLIHNLISEATATSNEKKKTTIGDNCSISPLSSIATFNVEIGNNVLIEEFVVIRENTVIGDNAIIRAGAVIGGHGYEFKRVNGAILSVAHAGGVVIGNHAEIQYNSCVDRGVYVWDNTVIGDYCKIDNLVHIAHGVKIHNNTMIVANVGIGGRTIIGSDSWIGFASTITNGITVGKNARANIGSVVTKSIPDGGSYTGNFAVEHSLFMKNLKKSLSNLEG